MVMSSALVGDQFSSKFDIVIPTIPLYEGNSGLDPKIINNNCSTEEN